MTSWFGVLNWESVVLVVMLITDAPDQIPAMLKDAEDLLRVHPRQSKPSALHRNDQHLEHRVFQHKTHVFEGFTSKYNVTSLVYFERHGDVMTAVRREKEMKAWRREEKVKLIETTNLKWKDLSYGWYQRHQFQPDADSIQKRIETKL